jgi:hypothetical protein
LSDRPLIKPNLNEPLVNAVSMAAQIISTPTSINRIPGISYDLAWTGTPVGTFAVQVSNTYSQSPDGLTVLNAGNWNTLPTSSFSGTYPVPSGSAGNGFLDVVGTEAAWVRLVYNPGSSTGHLTVVVAAKVL